MDYANLTQDEFLRLTAPEEPADFVSFWKETYALATAQTPTWHIEREIWSQEEDTRTYLVRAKTWDNCEIAMWISRPENSKGGLLIGQGSGQPATAGYYPSMTVCFPCVRGLGQSQCKDIPWVVKKHVLHGIASKATYILRGVVSDLWTAATVMTEMFPDTAENLCYSGGSMGGGMGALMLPWDKRFRAAYLLVPTFGGNHVRLLVPSTGSGEAVRLYVQEHPEAMDVLAYFDAAISAKYISIPTIVCPALDDKCVAPAGQFCVANSIPEEYRQMYILDQGHAAGTDRDKELMEKVEEVKKKLFYNEAE